MPQKLKHPDIKITNVVSSFSFDKELNLEKVHSAFPRNSIFDEAVFNFNVVVLRVKNPKMSFLIYRTGSVVCTGAKRLKDAEKSDAYLLELLRSNGFNINLISKAKIRNVVATANLGNEIDLVKISTHLKNIEYEPEQFPGMTYEVKEGRKMLLFKSGKIVCVGFRNIKDIENVLIELREKLDKYGS